MAKKKAKKVSSGDQIISMRLPRKLLSTLDKASTADQRNRSDLIRLSLEEVYKPMLERLERIKAAVTAAIPNIENDYAVNLVPSLNEPHVDFMRMRPGPGKPGSRVFFIYLDHDGREPEVAVHLRASSGTGSEPDFSGSLDGAVAHLHNFLLS